MHRSSEGFVLLLTLILLFLLSIILMGNIKQVSLNREIVQHYRDYTYALQHANSAMHKAANKLLLRPELVYQERSHYYFFKIWLNHQDSCHHRYYKVLSEGFYHHAQVSLQGEYQLASLEKSPPCRDDFTRRLVYWAILTK